ncbi:MAG: hypothetical protein ACFNUJ_07730 [Campylobacter curvus]
MIKNSGQRKTEISNTIPTSLLIEIFILETIKMQTRNTKNAKTMKFSRAKIAKERCGFCTKSLLYRFTLRFFTDFDANTAPLMKKAAIPMAQEIKEGAFKPSKKAKTNEPNMNDDSKNATPARLIKR